MSRIPLLMAITLVSTYTMQAQASRTIDSTFSRVGRVLLWNGRILVTDQVDRTVRLYSPDGVLVRSRQFLAGTEVGSFAGGPMWLSANDSLIFCTDITTPRILVFDTLLNFRSMLSASTAGVTGVCVTDDGSLFVPQFLGTESMIELVTPGRQSSEKISIASSTSDPYSTYCTLIALPWKRSLLLFHYSNSVWLMEGKRIARKIDVEGLTEASRGNRDIRNIQSNSLQTAFSDGADGFWIVEGELGSLPRRSMRHYTADGREIGRAVMPVRTYFAASDARGGFLYVVPDDRQRVLRYPLNMLPRNR